MTNIILIKKSIAVLHIYIFKKWVTPMVFHSEQKNIGTEALGQHRDVAEEKYGKAVTMGVTW